MNALFVFDTQPTRNDTIRIAQGAWDGVDLFPLTSDAVCINEIIRYLEAHNIDVNLLNSADIIDGFVNKMRGQVDEWSYRIGNIQILRKSLREWLITPGGEMSTWWFNILSEKNPLKTDLFLNIAQIGAVIQVLDNQKYTHCWSAISNRKSRKCVRRISLAQNTQFVRMKTIKTNRQTTEEKIENIFEKLGLLGDVLYALAMLLRYAYRGLVIRKTIGSFNARRVNRDGFLFISYFPAIDEDRLREGYLVNHYAHPLQLKMDELGLDINWLMIYAKLNDKSFTESARIGKKIAEIGESIFFVEEFFTTNGILRSLYAYLIQVLTYFLLRMRITQKVLSASTGISETGNLILPEFRKSIVGRVGMQGIVFLEIFKSALRVIRDQRLCVYFMEMQPWEKALNAAKRKTSCAMKTVGYHHTAISRNYFHLHLSKYDNVQDNISDLPLPDIFGCNGSMILQEMEKTTTRRTIPLEAIRYLHVNNVKPVSLRADRPLLLIIGSVDKKESKNILSLLHHTFPTAKDFDIVFKSHPNTPLDGIFLQLGIDFKKIGYHKFSGNLPDILWKSWAILVATSTVSIEALASGCEIIVP
ncbi:hypothetical protein KKA69_06080, partial [Patescibacteria group bacterium]|nr:hypothetical protein [Patescibacteria group bacterium]